MPTLRERSRERMLAILVFALLCAISPAVAQESLHAEHKIKTAFLYNFLRFVTWPDHAGHESGAFDLCMLGAKPLSGLVDGLSGAAAGDRSIRIRRLETPDQAQGCHVVYVGREFSEHLESTMSLFKGRPILTVSDVAGFTSHGGIIEFMVIDDKIRFDIHIGAATDAGLMISSKLLMTANAVKGDP